MALTIKQEVIWNILLQEYYAFCNFSWGGWDSGDHVIIPTFPPEAWWGGGEIRKVIQNAVAQPRPGFCSQFGAVCHPPSPWPCSPCRLLVHNFFTLPTLIFPHCLNGKGKMKMSSLVLGSKYKTIHFNSITLPRTVVYFWFLINSWSEYWAHKWVFSSGRSIPGRVFTARPVGSVHHFPSHSTSWNSVLWLHLTTRDFGNCSGAISIYAQEEEEAGLLCSQWLSLRNASGSFASWAHRKDSL